MLVFQTALPLKATVTRRQCVDLWIQWVTGDERLPFEESDFRQYDRNSRDDLTLTKGQAAFVLSHFRDDHVKLAACSLREQGDETRETQCVYVKEQGRVRLNIQMYCTGSAFDAQSPAHRSPAIMRLFIQAGLCDLDGGFETSDQPIVMIGKLMKPCMAAMKGAGNNVLPLVYCSKGLLPSALPVRELAKELQGIAHVVVENKRHLSKQLRKGSDGRSVFNGRVGIYLPGQTERKVFGAVFGGRIRKEKIVRAVRCVWLNADGTNEYSWNSFQMLKSWQQTGRLQARSGALSEAEELIKLYEEENDQLSAQCKVLEEEKWKLNEEMERLQSLVGQHVPGGVSPKEMLLRRGREPDLYSGEQNDLLMDVLEDALKNCQEGTRPYTLIKSIRAANTRDGSRDTIKAAIEKAFSGNGGVNTERQIRLLKSVGFEFKAAGKHNKITFAKDRRYVFTVACTPSDRRAGENVISEITRKLFYK